MFECFRGISVQRGSKNALTCLYVIFCPIFLHVDEGKGIKSGLEPTCKEDAGFAVELVVRSSFALPTAAAVELRAINGAENTKPIFRSFASQQQRRVQTQAERRQHLAA